MISEDTMITSVFADSGDENDQPIKDKGKGKSVRFDLPEDSTDLTKDSDKNESIPRERVKDIGSELAPGRNPYPNILDESHQEFQDRMKAKYPYSAMISPDSEESKERVARINAYQEFMDAKQERDYAYARQEQARYSEMLKNATDESSENSEYSVYSSDIHSNDSDHTKSKKLEVRETEQRLKRTIEGEEVQNTENKDIEVKEVEQTMKRT